MAADHEAEEIRRQKIAKIISQSQQKAIPNHVVEIESVDHFNQLVNDYQEELIIIDFWAEWCGPCKAFAPAFASLQKEFQAKRVIFAKLNVDHHQEIAQQFQVSGIPTTMFVQGKKVRHRQVGMAPKPQFASIIDGVLKKIGK